MIDLHSHLLPGVDDGARDPTEAAAGIERMAGQGCRTIVVTPHVDASVTRDPVRKGELLSGFDSAWDSLTGQRTETDIPVIRRGTEIRLDVPEPDLSDDRLRLGGTQAVLVEFAHMRAPPNSERVLYQMRTQGYRPVLAHPERYLGAADSPEAARSWAKSAVLQANAGSFLGWYGESVRIAARRLLAEGLISVIASDYHARGEPAIARARALIEELSGPETARILFDENPLLLLQDRELLPMPAPARANRTGLLSRLLWRRGAG